MPTLTFDLRCISSRRPSPSLGADTRMFSETTCRSHNQLSYMKSDDDNEDARPSTVDSSDVDAATTVADRITIATSIEIAALTAAVAKRTPPTATTVACIVDVRIWNDIDDRHRKWCARTRKIVVSLFDGDNSGTLRTPSLDRDVSVSCDRR